MKKIFYSLMAVALCACAQSDVEDDGTQTPPPTPQPESNGLTFTVVDNGFIDESSTRVVFGDYIEGARENNLDAYKATFEESDEIGVYAIKSGLIDAQSGIPNDDDTNGRAYTVRNAKLTLKNGVWTGDLGDIGEADLLFAYTPYSTTDYTLDSDGKPKFTKNESGSWEVDTGNNRFFKGHGLYGNDVITKCDSKDALEAVDMMGAVYTLNKTKSAEETEHVVFKMHHMRGMIELTTDKNVTLNTLTLTIGEAVYTYNFYIFNEADKLRTKNVYRILTTEYTSSPILKASITDNTGVTAVTKNYKKTLQNKNAAGYCALVNINYAPVITVSEGKTLAAILEEKYGSEYATRLTTLKLAGTLQGTSATDGDWATIRSLSALKTLDMSALENKSIPVNWLYRVDTNAPASKSITKLILSNKLENIESNALQLGTQLTNIVLPTSVKKVGWGAFYGCTNLSVCIPEGSKLETIVNGAFDNIKALYTNANDMNTVVLPATITTINGANSLGVSSLKRVIFKGATAPTTLATDAFSRATNATIYVPNSTSYKKTSGTGLFPGKTVVAGPILTADNYASNYTYNDGDPNNKQLPALCDNDITTFWHTTYWGDVTSDVNYGEYIEITVPTSMNSLAVLYATRFQNDNATPTKINVYTSNDGTNWGTPLFQLTKDSNSLPQTAGKSIIIPKQTATASFTKVRFAIIESKQGSLCGTIGKDANNYTFSTALAELLIGEDIWTEAAAN